MFAHARRSLARPSTVLAVTTCAAAVALTGCSSSGGGAAPNRSVSTAPAACSTTAAPALSGAALPFGTESPTGTSSALQVSAGHPTVTSSPSGRSGYRLVKVPVTASVRTNGTFAVDHSQFVLVGPAGRRCSQPQINPLSDGFVALTVDESHPGSGTVAFQVPSSVPVSRLSVRYLPAVRATSASLSWRTGATRPNPPKVTNACDGAKSTYRTQGVDDVSFGKSVEHGDDVVSARIRASAPTRRAFEPGPNQPNNVDAIDVKLHVTANGADAYVDRRSFVLVDGGGHLCRRATLSSQGETLSSALVKKGHSADYRIVFWAPKGGAIHGLRLLELTAPGGTKVRALWSDSKLTLQPLQS